MTGAVLFPKMTLVSTRRGGLSAESSPTPSPSIRVRLPGPASPPPTEKPNPARVVSVGTNSGAALPLAVSCKVGHPADIDRSQSAWRPRWHRPDGSTGRRGGCPAACCRRRGAAAKSRGRLAGTTPSHPLAVA